MPEGKSHKSTANRIAHKFGTEYNDARGADIQTSQVAVEVEPAESINDALRQLQGYRKRVYIAGTNQDAVEKALEDTKGTTVGVMDSPRQYCEAIYSQEGLMCVSHLSRDAGTLIPHRVLLVLRKPNHSPECVKSRRND